MQDPNGHLLDNMVPELTNATDDALLDSLGTVPSKDVMAAATGGGSFKLLVSISVWRQVELGRASGSHATMSYGSIVRYCSKLKACWVLSVKFLHACLY